VELFAVDDNEAIHFALKYLAKTRVTVFPVVAVKVLARGSAFVDGYFEFAHSDLAMTAATNLAVCSGVKFAIFTPTVPTSRRSYAGRNAFPAANASRFARALAEQTIPRPWKIIGRKAK
jgi:hypothetical protein